MKVYTVYKTTNCVNNKYYIGVHKTENPEDDYLGSGTVLKLSIKKYGKENFKKEVLFIFDNIEEAYQKEYELVNEAFVKCEDNYNLHIGGSGGLAFEYINNDVEFRKAKNRRAAAAMRESPILQTQEYKEKMRRVYANIAEKQKQAFKDGKRTVSEKSKTSFKGKKHTEETLQKLSDFQKINQSGNKNSQFGTRWCNDGVNNLKISKDACIPDGYNLGKIKLTKEERKPRVRKSQKKYENYDFGQAKRKFSDDQIAQSLISNDHDVPKAMKELGYKHLNGNSWRRFVKVLKSLIN